MTDTPQPALAALREQARLTPEEVAGPVKYRGRALTDIEIENLRVGKALRIGYEAGYAAARKAEADEWAALTPAEQNARIRSAANLRRDFEADELPF